MCSLKQTVLSSGLGGMARMGVKNANEEAAFPKLNQTLMGHALGWNPALAPAPPSCSGVNDFVICALFFLVSPACEISSLQALREGKYILS